MTSAKLKKLSEKYPNQWVAIKESTGEVVGNGKSPKEAYQKSQEKGVKEPVITKIPKDYATYILTQI
ncbi:DUF5678 domain-containing protein [Candidatus Microgenomates bacterium]|nr:DUF5678 domain-containing protein [Candidatus Microgenomates bacterium]